MSASDELYARALQYRDNNVPECSAEASRVEAEKNFLELSQQGHKKAMHNYAVLQQKRGNYKLAAEWFTKAGLDASNRNIKAMKECGQIKEDLYLVVANDRSKAGNQGSPILDPVYGSAVEMTHLHSFGGNATTCDIKRCALSDAKHIVADALTFDFTKKYNLKHVLIERPPTVNPASPCPTFGPSPACLEGDGLVGLKNSARDNFVGSMVHNISKAMEPGAILEIEWDPYTTQVTLPQEDCEEYHIINPFHGFIHVNATVLGAQSANPHSNVYFPPELQAMAREYGNKFQKEVEFWHSQGAGGSEQETYQRMHAEAALFVRLLNTSLRDKSTAPLAFVEANVLTDPTAKVVAALKNETYGNFSSHLTGQHCQMHDGRKGKVYCPGTLMSDTVMGIAVNSLAAQNNTPYAKSFLESIGFKDVVIERRTNTHNGRKNVWMVTAVKG